jgi:Predicted nucleic acid-binding protein, contains PIN domain
VKTLVVDSSALVSVLLANGEVPVAAAGPLAGHTLAAPYLIDVEVLNVARKLALRNTVSMDDAETLLRDFRRTAIDRYPHTSLFDLAWSLRENIAPHDAMYVALSATLRATLATSDRRLAQSAAKHCDVYLLR